MALKKGKIMELFCVWCDIKAPSDQGQFSRNKINPEVLEFICSKCLNEYKKNRPSFKKKFHYGCINCKKPFLIDEKVYHIVIMKRWVITICYNCFQDKKLINLIKNKFENLCKKYVHKS